MRFGEDNKPELYKPRPAETRLLPNGMALKDAREAYARVEEERYQLECQIKGLRKRFEMPKQLAEDVVYGGLPLESALAAMRHARHARAIWFQQQGRSYPGEAGERIEASRTDLEWLYNAFHVKVPKRIRNEKKSLWMLLEELRMDVRLRHQLFTAMLGRIIEDDRRYRETLYEQSAEARERRKQRKAAKAKEAIAAVAKENTRLTELLKEHAEAADIQDNGHCGQAGPDG